jgi:hypothetical protein
VRAAVGCEPTQRLLSLQTKKPPVRNSDQRPIASTSYELLLPYRGADNHSPTIVEGTMANLP